MKGSEFVFDSIGLLHYKLDIISLNRGGSYIDSPKWIKKQETNNKKTRKRCEICSNLTVKTSECSSDIKLGISWVVI